MKASSLRFSLPILMLSNLLHPLDEFLWFLSWLLNFISFISFFSSHPHQSFFSCGFNYTVHQCIRVSLRSFTFCVVWVGLFPFTLNYLAFFVSHFNSLVWTTGSLLQNAENTLNFTKYLPDNGAPENCLPVHSRFVDY
jgi:hypothetical protein